MLKITVFQNNEDCTGIRSEGHAGYAQAGSDIVCAAVSVLLINTLNSIEQFTDDDFEGKEDDGFLEFHFTGEMSEGSKLLMKSLILGLMDIRESYGSTYLDIAFREV